MIIYMVTGIAGKAPEELQWQAEKAQELRALGHLVFLPQETGIVNTVEDPTQRDYVTRGKLRIPSQWARLWEGDLQALRQTTQGIVLVPKGHKVSTGQATEIGWLTARNVPIFGHSEDREGIEPTIYSLLVNWYFRWSDLVIHLKGD